MKTFRRALIIVLAAAAIIFVLGLSLFEYVRRTEIAAAEERFQKQLAIEKDHLARGRHKIYFYDTDSLLSEGSTDRILAEVSGHKNLVSVGFETSGVTVAGFENLAKCSNLERVYVSWGNMEFDDECLQKLANHPRLKEIVLLQTPITDHGLDVLTTFPNLRRMRINNWYESNLSETATEKLAVLKQLEELKLNGKWVTEDVLLKLRETLPNTHIERDTQGW